MKNRGEQQDYWYKSPWFWILTLVIVSILISIGMYWLHVGKGQIGFSKSGQDWANFGSYLSGIFTMAGALGTVGTLVYLVKQYYRQLSLWQDQTEALQFERYHKHFELFRETLKGIEGRCGNDFMFSDPIALYEKIFPNNKPSKFTSPKGDEETLRDILEGYHSIPERFEGTSKDVGKTLGNKILCENDFFSMDFARSTSDGDYIVFGHRTGLNSHSPEIIVDHYYKTISALFDFAGLDKNDVRDMRHLAQYPDLSKKLNDWAAALRNNADEEYYVDLIKGKYLLLKLREYFQEKRAVSIQCEQAYCVLALAFQNKTSANKLIDDNSVNDLVISSKQAMETIPDDQREKYYESLDKKLSDLEVSLVIEKHQ